jgi:hypothetical protein
MSMSARQLAAATTFALVAAPEAAGAASQMFKCVEGGRTVYQQQACAVRADPEPAASAPPTASSAAEPASAGARKIKRPSPAASSAPATPR